MSQHRIRAVVEKTGIPGMTLRTWERRYGFPKPRRNTSGYRVYTDDDVRAVLAVRQLIARGVIASEAIANVEGGRAPSDPAARVRAFISAARLLSELDVEGVVRDAALHLSPAEFCTHFATPALHRAASELDIAAEHLATSVLRGQLRRTLELAPPPKRKAPVVLACPEHEEHEGGLLLIAVELRFRGRRAIVLGANTPATAITQAARLAKARCIGLSLVGKRSKAELRRLLQAVVASADGIAVVAGGACANQHRDLLEACGVAYADSAEALLELVK